MPKIPSRCHIKICGMTRVEDALLAAELGADAIGLIFAKSPRRATLTQAKAIVRELPAFINVVGVFVNESADAMLRTADKVGLDTLQLHGDESPTFVKKLKFPRKIKALRVGQQFDFSVARSYECPLLLDAYSKQAYGGTGETFAWDAIPKTLRKQITLAGGITPSNVAKAINTVRPYAIDASSGLERSAGIKSHRAMRDFFAQIKKTD